MEFLNQPLGLTGLVPSDGHTLEQRPRLANRGRSPLRCFSTEIPDSISTLAPTILMVRHALALRLAFCRVLARPQVAAV